MKFLRIMLFLLLLTLSGCATSNNDSSGEAQGPPSMSGGKGMGRGGGGKHGPPEREEKEKQAEKQLPEEAFSACKDKVEGETVLLVLPDGEEIKAKCTVVDDHMVALPEEPGKGGRR